MGKLIRHLNHKLRNISGDDLTALWTGRRHKRYAKDLDRISTPTLPKDIREAMFRDVQKVGSDMKSALNKING